MALLETRDAYVWSTHGGAELDLFVTVGGRRLGFEFNYADAPGRTRSMHVAREDLGLERLLVVYPGTRAYELDATTAVVPIAMLPDVLGHAKVLPSRQDAHLRADPPR